jgi:hypothetical protein
LVFYGYNIINHILKIIIKNVSFLKEGKLIRPEHESLRGMWTVATARGLCGVAGRCWVEAQNAPKAGKAPGSPAALRPGWLTHSL